MSPKPLRKPNSEFRVPSSELNSKLSRRTHHAIRNTSTLRSTATEDGQHATRSTAQSSIRKPQSAIPSVSLNVAMTADGKLAPANRVFIPFGSQRDRELLLELRAQADAVMSGARTVDLSPVNLGPGPARFRRKRRRRGLAEYNLRVVVSGSGTLDPKAEIFQHRFSPIVILTTERISKQRLRKLQRVADEVKICGKAEVDFAAACRWLRRQWGVKRLLCEGGGEVNEGLLRAGLVDEIHVTLCPLLFGGRDAPTLADGQGVKRLSDATALSLKSRKRFGAELFLVYRVSKSRKSGAN